jgi:hypothetical protein
MRTSFPVLSSYFLMLIFGVTLSTRENIILLTVAVQLSGDRSCLFRAAVCVCVCVCSEWVCGNFKILGEVKF